MAREEGCLLRQNVVEGQLWVMGGMGRWVTSLGKVLVGRSNVASLTGQSGPGA